MTVKRSSVFLRTVSAAIAAIVCGCQTAAPPAFPDVVLRAEQGKLRAEAQRALSSAGMREGGGGADEVLLLREEARESVSSFASDGAAAQYSVDYRLRFSYGGKTRTVSLSETADYDAGLHHAGRRQREAVVRSLRQRALAEMLHILGGEKRQ